MTTLVTNTTRRFSTPYITVAEYKQAPTGIDYNTLVTNSTDPAVQDAELANNIARASSWIDTYCNQVLGATVETEQQRSRLRSDGTIAIHPRYNPIIAVSDFWYGIYPNQMVQYPDPSVGWIEDSQFIIPYSSANVQFSSQGPLQFGLPAIPRAQIYCKFTYVNGYANARLASGVSASATSLTVSDATGITAGTQMTIYDGLATENILVASSYVYGSTTIPLVQPLAYAHSSGVSVSALPPAVKEAAILATTAFLKVRGDNSMVMAVTNAPSMATQDTQKINDEMHLAMDMLKTFRRIR